MRSQTRRGTREEVGLEEGQRVGGPRAVWMPEVSYQRRSAEKGGVRLDPSQMPSWRSMATKTPSRQIQL
jgi:hypothetical protein